MYGSLVYIGLELAQSAPGAVRGISPRYCVLLQKHGVNRDQMYDILLALAHLACSILKKCIGRWVDSI